MKIEPHIGIVVCNGGYAVHALVRDGDGEWQYETSVFSSVEVMTGYVVRVAHALEGSGEVPDLPKLGRR